MNLSFEAYCDALLEHNTRMERQHAEAKSAGELRACLCPYPTVVGDWSVSACLAAGNCGCDVLDRLAAFKALSPIREKEGA